MELITTWKKYAMSMKQTAEGDRDEDGTTGSSNTGAHHDEDTRTDGTSEAQTEDVKQAKLFTFIFHTLEPSSV